MNRIKRWLLAATAVTSITVAAATRSAEAQTSFYGSASSGSFSISFFYDELDDYGRWVDYGNYGACWVPARVAEDWRPYSYGHWMYTDYGWTWASSEPWGWATYHYGRWVLDPYYGWVWVPGTVWAPAWVAWREGPDYIGWAPLGPEVGWSVSVGLTFGGYSTSRIPYSNWCFVDRNRFDSRDVRGYVYRADRNDDVFRTTRDVTRFRSRNGAPVNEGVAVSSIERSTGRRIPRMRVAAVDSPNRGQGRQISGNTVGYFRPTIRGSRRDLTTQIERRGRIERVTPGRTRDAERGNLQQRTERARGQSGQVERTRGRDIQRDYIERSQQRAAERQRVQRSRDAERTRSVEQNPNRNVERSSRIRTERAPREFQPRDRGRDNRLESPQERRVERREAPQERRRVERREAPAPREERQREVRSERGRSQEEVRSEERGRSRESGERGRGSKGGKGNKDEK